MRSAPAPASIPWSGASSPIPTRTQDPSITNLGPGGNRDACAPGPGNGTEAQTDVRWRSREAPTPYPFSRGSTLSASMLMASS